MIFPKLFVMILIKEGRSKKEDGKRDREKERGREAGFIGYYFITTKRPMYGFPPVIIFKK